MENNKINIAEILKDCPKGTKLYSPLFGELKLNGTLENKNKVSILSTGDDGKEYFDSFSKNGSYYPKYSQSECLLFPSSKMRDWSKFFKRGDAVYIKEANNVTDYAIFDSWKNDDYTEFNASIFYSNKSGFAEKKVCTVKLYTKANEILKAKLITFIERHYNGKYNPDTLQVEPVKPECPFKPFDKVLVRDNNEQEWKINFFSHYNKDVCYKYYCLKSCYNQCIPYEGNEHLLGTTDSYTEGGNK